LPLSVACSSQVQKQAQPVRATAVEDWAYEVAAGSGARELAVQASFPRGTDPEFSVDDGAEPFVRDVAVLADGVWQTVVAKDNTWVVSSCRTAGCSVRYRFLLADASAQLRDPDLAMVQDDVFVAPPSTWLLRPLSVEGERAFRLHVTTPNGVSFATGVFPSSSEAGTYRAKVADLPVSPYSAFGPLRFSHIDTGGGALDVALAPGDFAAGESTVLDWIRTCAGIVASYYGRFPVERALLIVLPSKGGRFGYGKTLGNGGASIVLPIGRETTRRALDDDWMLVHEMIHLAFPSVPRQHLWLEEGIATYVEPIARARAGRLSPETVWTGLVRGLPNGLPEPGDRGLDNTHTWGRTYWGGALFCLLADLEIRERTQNRRSLDDALRAILWHGGNISVRWELARALDEGDRATGVPVLADLHRRMGQAPYPVDLPALWKRLGVKLTGNRLVFDDSAPLAAVRRSMTDAPLDGQGGVVLKKAL
jgi:predicted metalloprotease with PDZ domain